VHLTGHRTEGTGFGHSDKFLPGFAPPNLSTLFATSGEVRNGQLSMPSLHC
jgi:hypothetical protein